MIAARTQEHDPELVTIVIPVYNGSRFVGSAIESALAQTWRVLEVIVVDDGSDDGGATQAVLKRFGNAIRIIVKPNGGVATALNTGIAAMRGQWFSWLSHDDLYHPLKIERYMDAVRDAGRPVVAFGDVDHIDEDGRFLHRVELTRGFSATDDPRWNVLEGRLNGCAMLVHRACFEACGLFNTRLPTTQDYALWFEVAARFPFVPVREALVRSRIHAEQGSRQARHLEEASLLWVTMLEQLDRDTPLDAATDRLQRLRRVQRFLRHSGYAGARAYIEARISQTLTNVPMALVCAVDSDPGPSAAVQTLIDAGLPCEQLVLIDRAAIAHASIAHDIARWPGATGVVRLPGQTANAMSVLDAALRHTTAQLLICLDGSAKLDASILREGVTAVAAGETDVWLSGSGTRSEHRWLGALCGSVLERHAAENAVRHAPHGLFKLGLESRVSLASPKPPTAITAPTLPHPLLRRDREFALGISPLRPFRPTLLTLVHSWGGGTIRYAQTVANLVKDRVNVVFGWGIGDQRFFLSSIGADTAEVEYVLPDEFDTLIRDVGSLRVARVDVMHSIGFDRYLDEFLDRLGVPFDLTFLDYHQFAVQPHLVDETGCFVGDDALCDRLHPLLRRRPLPLRVHGADRLIACSRDLAGRIERLFPELKVTAARLPEPGTPETFALHGPPLGPNEEMRVLFIGRLAKHKGAPLIASVAELLRVRGLNIRIDCLGGIDADIPSSLLFQPNVRLLGSYDHHDLNALICHIRPHLAWLPFTAPESHSFALTDAMLQGLPVLATGVGAIVERLAGRPKSWLIPFEEASPDISASWLDKLLRERLSTPPRWLPTNHLPPLAEGFYTRDYIRPIGSS
jgi:glycosyltransferase involved in cell wall biosynthesis